MRNDTPINNNIDIFYTFVDNFNEHTQSRIMFHGNSEADQLFVSFPQFNMFISLQQLAEIGHLCLALAGNNYEMDSVDELIDGYNLDVQEVTGIVTEELIVQKKVAIMVKPGTTDEEIDAIIRNKAYSSLISDYSIEHGWQCMDTLDVDVKILEGHE